MRPYNNEKKDCMMPEGHNHLTDIESLDLTVSAMMLLEQAIDQFSKDQLPDLTVKKQKSGNHQIVVAYSKGEKSITFTIKLNNFTKKTPKKITTDAGETYTVDVNKPILTTFTIHIDKDLNDREVDLLNAEIVHLKPTLDALLSEVVKEHLRQTSTDRNK